VKILFLRKSIYISFRCRSFGEWEVGGIFQMIVSGGKRRETSFGEFVVISFINQVPSLLLFLRGIGVGVDGYLRTSSTGCSADAG
jgi:hypothetical protein